MEEVAHDNADVVFTTSIRMRPACLKVAAQHPKTRFLNCCLNAPHPLVRTYYPRTYEANYLLGMLAGILNLTDRVGYVAANPVYGVPAAVNAFARGLRTVRPNSHILLRWACLQEPGNRWISPTARISSCSTPAAPLSLPAAPGIRPVPPDAGWQHPAGGAAGLEVGSVLYRHHPLHLRGHLGQRLQRQGHQLLVGLPQ